MCLDLAGDAGNYTAAIENPTGGAPQRRRYLVRTRCVWDVVLLALAFLDAAQELGSHAFVSTIKLRRMMRDAPGPETRIKSSAISSQTSRLALFIAMSKASPGKDY
jgi:hypothetical protein